MYGSSLRMLTRRPRAFRIRPMLAAVMPLPRLLATPPVTKTYFDMGQGSSGVFLMLQKSPPGRESRRLRAAQLGGHEPGGGSTRPSPQTSGPQNQPRGGGAS